MYKRQVLLIAALFIFSFLLSPMTLLVTLILVCTFSEAMMNGMWRSRIVFLAALALAAILLCLTAALVAPGRLDIYHSLLIVTLLSLVFVAVYAYRSNLRNIYITLGLFIGSMIFLPTTDYIFNSILKQHQRDRILSFLGIISDPLGSDYNVNQAKIAIGSGNFWGKGFLEGTQIKYGFVPERHTDFIFCTVGEEWGFLGAVVVLSLLCILILLLLRGGDPAVPCAGQRGHDHRTDARHGHPAALHELRRFVAHRLYDPVVHRRAARRLDAAVFPDQILTMP